MQVTTDEECIKTFSDMKFGKIDAQYIIYQFVKEPGNEHIVIDYLPRK